MTVSHWLGYDCHSLYGDMQLFIVHMKYVPLRTKIYCTLAPSNFYMIDWMECKGNIFQIFTNNYCLMQLLTCNEVSDWMSWNNIMYNWLMIKQRNYYNIIL